MKFRLSSVLLLLIPFLLKAGSLTLLPAKFTLDGPAAEQRLVLELADGKTLLGSRPVEGELGGEQGEGLRLKQERNQ